jgi:hypothetical protein
MEFKGGWNDRKGQFQVQVGSGDSGCNKGGFSELENVDSVFSKE